MAKRKRKVISEFWETDGAANYSPIHHDLLDGEAFISLSAYAVKLYLYMRRKHTRKVSNGIVHDSNYLDISMPRKGSIQRDKHGVIQYGYEHLGLSARQFYKAIDQLIEHGFIKLIKNGYDTRTCNIYGFTDAWKRYGQPGYEIKPEHRRLLKQKK